MSYISMKSINARVSRILFFLSFCFAWTMHLSAVVPADSIIALKGGACKAICSFASVYGPRYVTVMYDRAHTPLLIIENATYKNGSSSVDTILIGENLKKLWQTSISYKQDGQRKEAHYDNIASTDQKWRLDTRVWPFQFVGADFDSAGNWTLSSSQTPVKRSIFYSLTPEDEAVVAHYAALRDKMTASVTPGLLGRFWPLVGLLPLIGTIILAYRFFGRYNYRATMELLPKLSVASGCAGLYLLSLVVMPELGENWMIGLVVVFLVAVFVFLKKVVDILAADRTRLNSTIDSVGKVSIAFLCITGFLIGYGMWDSFWSAIITAAIFAFSGSSGLLGRDERCPKCHHSGTIKFVERVNCGIHTQVSTSDNARLGPWKTKELYHSSEGHYSRSQANRRHTVTETTVKYQKYRIKSRCEHCGYEIMSGEYRERISTEHDTSYYDETIERKINIH